MSEFEDREYEEGLNELPEPVGNERVEREGYVKEGSRFDDVGTSPPIDIMQQNKVQSAPGQMGSIPMGFDVTSVYDARPVNGRDFLSTIRSTFTYPGEIFGPDTNEILFQVPDGYTGVLRGFKYTAFPIIVPDAGATPVVTVIADGVNLVNYTDLILPLSFTDFVPVYGLSNALKTIGLRITYPDPVDSSVLPDDDIIVTVTLYGNLLLSRGLPIQYEPTNRKF